VEVTNYIHGFDKRAGSTVREIEKEFERLQLPIEDIAKQWGNKF